VKRQGPDTKDGDQSAASSASTTRVVRSRKPVEKILAIETNIEPTGRILRNRKQVEAVETLSTNERKKAESTTEDKSITKIPKGKKRGQEQDVEKRDSLEENLVSETRSKRTRKQPEFFSAGDWWFCKVSGKIR